MSTKASISHSDKHHFYEECLDNSNVYLQIDNPPGLQVDFWEASQGSATLVIPIETWRQVVEDWIISCWGKDPDRDNAEIELNPNFNALFAATKSKKETEDEEDEREFTDTALNDVLEAKNEAICDVCGRVVDEYETVSCDNLSGVVMCAGKMKDSCKSPLCEEDNEG